MTTAIPVTTTTYRVMGCNENACPVEVRFITISVDEVPTVNLGADFKVNADTPTTLLPSQLVKSGTIHGVRQQD